MSQRIPGNATRLPAVSRDERTTLSNELRLLVNGGGGGVGPVSVNRARQGGDLAGLSGGASLRSISRTLGHSMDVLRVIVARTGGQPPGNDARIWLHP